MAQYHRRVSRLLSRDRQKRARLRELGIDYQFPGYAACTQPHTTPTHTVFTHNSDSEWMYTYTYKSHYSYQCVYKGNCLHGVKKKKSKINFYNLWCLVSHCSMVCVSESADISTSFPTWKGAHTDGPSDLTDSRTVLMSCRFARYTCVNREQGLFWLNAT